MPIKPRINLNGAMDLIKKSDNPLRPLYEAITNALEALSVKSFEKDEAPKIHITLNFTGMFEDLKKLTSIEIFDNGVGFSPVNYNRFSEFFDKSKGYNNRGTGRLQYYHRFGLVSVESIFQEGSLSNKRSFSCNPDRFIFNEEHQKLDTPKPSYTHVRMSNPKLNAKEETYFSELTIEELAHKITQTYLLRFYLDEQKDDYQVPEITLTYNKTGEELETEKLWEDDIPEPTDTGNFTVSYSKVEDTAADKINWIKVPDKKETIKWAHFKIPDSDLDQNGAYLCSKDITVQKLRLKDINNSDAIEGNRFLTVFYGDIFDAPENVSDTVDSFNFPDKKTIEQNVGDMFFEAEQNFLFMDDITDKIKSEIPYIYKDLLTAIDEQKIDVQNIARSHGISESIVKKISLGLADDEKTITKKLYEEQSRHLAKQGYKVKQLFESLKSLNPTEPKYQEQLKQKTKAFSKLVDEQNKEELSRYVLRREMVADVLNKILSEDLDIQKPTLEKGQRRDREGLIHDLIFTRKSKTDVLNDLWVLNEEFLHFEGTSELPINQIEDEKGERLLQDVPADVIEEYGLKFDRRPDIFLFASEGKCVIIELKAPNVDVSDYLNQMPKYCVLIANYSKVPIHKFYCYLIGEKFNPITDLGEYNETVTGDWIRRDIPIKSIPDGNKIASQQIEIIKLSSLYERAHRRNKSFADKLGVRELLEADMQSSAKNT